MKNLYISEMLLLSKKERKAKRVLFDRYRTIVIGSNHTGKSSLIKCIYYAFGAEPFFGKSFEDAKIICSVKFELNELCYQIIREGKAFAIFKNGEIQGTFNSVTKDLAPYLGQLFDFNPQFQHIKGEYILPPPAYLLLPYYVDQDMSWGKSWASFKNLTQIKDYRNNCIFYHSGLRSNEYYELKKEVCKHQMIIDETGNEQKITNKIRSNLKNKLSQSEFNVDVELFRKEITALLVEFEKIKIKEENLKSELHDLYHSKATYDIQIAIIMQAMHESSEDLQYALESIPTSINCPTCGAQYDNSFAERFEIAQDKHKCKELLIEITQELEEVLILIENTKNDLSRTSLESIRIEEILQMKKGELKLKDVIESSGKNEVHNIFEERSKELDRIILDNTRDVKAIEEQLKFMDSKKNKEPILNYYKSILESFLNKLDVGSIDEQTYKDIRSKVEDAATGSSRPRILTAYYFAFFHLMKKFSKTTYFPLVVDSPNQQDQDDKHVKDIMNFINENQPEDSQLILGLTNTFDVDFKCHMISLGEKYSLLQEDEFDDVNRELLDKRLEMWGRANNPLGLMFSE